jgi:hypothetical protein
VRRAEIGTLAIAAIGLGIYFFVAPAISLSESPLMSPACPIGFSQAALAVSLMALIACASETGGANGGLADFGGSLGEPSAVFAEDFGSIQTVREVAGGMLVADPLGGALYFVDMNAGTRTVVGTEGQGPGEYLQPDAVWPLLGDSTLLVDLGNGRMITLGRPDLEFGPTSPLSAGSPRSGGMVVAIPQAKVVVGFGTGSAYVVAFDEFDLNYLERFDMPAM